MDQPISHRRNRLLGVLPPDDLAILATHLKEVHFEQGVVLHEADDTIEQVYFLQQRDGFPVGGDAGTAPVSKPRQSVARGLSNVTAGLGSHRSASRAVMQVAGDVSQITAARFRTIVESSPAIRKLVVECNDIQMALV